MTIHYDYPDDYPLLKWSVVGICQWLTTKGTGKCVPSRVGLCGDISFDDLSKTEHSLDDLSALVFLILWLRLCHAYLPTNRCFVSGVFLQIPTTPETELCFEGTKSRCVTKNWSGSVSGYIGGLNETNKLDGITEFSWDMVVNNLSGSLTFELIVKSRGVPAGIYLLKDNITLKK